MNSPLSDGSLEDLELSTDKDNDMRRHLYTGLLVLGLHGCAQQPASTTHIPTLQEAYGSASGIRDLYEFPQETAAFAENIVEKTLLLDAQKNYDLKYFEPWSYTKPPMDLKRILWPFTSYTYGAGFDETLQSIDEAWFLDMSAQSNFEKYGALSRPGVALRYLNVRNFPTLKPFFKDPKKAGEGFPFDYLQNSGVNPNEPLFVSHLSKDGRWAYIFTSYITGWVDSRDIAYLDNTVVQRWMQARQVEISDERHSISDLDSNFVFTSRIGMRLPLISVEKDHYIALAITAAANNKPIYTKVKVPLSIAQTKPMLINKSNLVKISSRLINKPYGWGGLYEERDCSSTLRDLFAPFGIWLPRNSYEQSKVGDIVSLEALDNESKQAKIIQDAVPFETFLYKKGHILLYLGTYQGKIAVLHNAWGVKTLHDGIEGRDIIGKTIISSLEPGKELKDYDSESGILSQIESMNIITR